MVEAKFVVHEVVLETMPQPSRTDDSIRVTEDTTVDAEHSLQDDTDHLNPITREQKEAIIKEWQDRFSTEKLQRCTCAACGIRGGKASMKLTHPRDIELRLLRNDKLPLAVRPRQYDFHLYSRAILHENGLTETRCLAPLWICGKCSVDLSEGTMPRFALCNWLYYGRDCLPTDVRQAFEEVSVFEKAMIARARTNSICCRFNSAQITASFGDNHGNGNVFRQSSKGMKGNVIMSPLDTVRLNECLPPTPESIRDTMCVLFVGKGKKPSRQDVEKYHPVLVRKSRVKLLIDFLLEYNPHYRAVEGFKGFSDEALNSLFDGTRDTGVPTSVEVAWVCEDGAIDSAVSSYVPEPSVIAHGTTLDPRDHLLMENVAYTTADHTPLAYRDMKMAAVQRCLSGKPFIRIRKGDRLIPDFNNPYILSWALPHLDPWGIGGFYHPSRERYISMEEQLSHMIQMDDRHFEEDSEFAFLFYNIIRKKNVSRGLRFSAPGRRYKRIVEDLLSIDQVRLFHLAEKLREDPSHKPSQEDDLRILETLKTVNLLARGVPGGAAQKIKMRNEIRSMVISIGAPTLFVTLNPSDKDHPLVQIFADSGRDIDSVFRGEELSDWERRVLASKKPAACAKFFDAMVKAFIQIVLRYDRPGAGLYGKCAGYYGTVEAQGRGTLHCHMLVWLRGHPAPNILRECLQRSSEYKEKLTCWLESIMRGDYVGQQSERSDVHSAWNRRLERELTGGGSIHPGATVGPLLKDMTRSSFWEEFERHTNQLLVEYNMHEHTSTCWKYLSRGDPKTPENCRMGITGEVYKETSFDERTMRVTVKKTHPKMTYFTDVVLFLLKCNTDIKFVGVGADANAFMYYVTDYITKVSMALHVGLAALAYSIKRIEADMRERKLESDTETDTLRAFIIAVNSMMGHQEISHQQVMSYLVGSGDHYTSGSFHAFNWGELLRYIDGLYEAPESGGATLRSQTETSSVTLALGDRELLVSNQRLDYMFRPSDEAYAGLCLYDFLCYTKKTKGAKRSGNSNGSRFSSNEHPQWKTHRLSMRRTPVIPVLLGPSITRRPKETEDMEPWAMRILTLFKPWRIVDDLKVRGQTWGDAFHKFERRLSKRHLTIISNIQTLAVSKDDRDHHHEKRRENRRVKRPSVSFDSLMGDGDFGDLVDLEQSVRDQTGCVYGTIQESSANDDELYSPSSTERLSTLLGETNQRELNQCYPVDAPGICVNVPDERAVKVLGVSPVDDESLEYIDRQLKHVADKRYDHITKSSKASSSATIQTISGNQSARVPTRPSVEIGVLSETETVPVIQVDVCGEAVNSKSSDWALATSIAIEKNLHGNTEQLRAYLIVARHIVFGGEQLLLHLSGMGGAGKSYVIEAITLLLERLNRRSELLVGAPTGIAATLIHGATLHSLIMANSSKKPGVDQKLVELWHGVKYLIIDEISMVGAAFLALISSRLRLAKGDDPFNSTRLFGGVNIICLGDFCQLKPVGQLPLFSEALVLRPSFEQVRNNHGLDAMSGAYLWRQFRTVVCLKKNNRQKTDPTFADVLRNIRLQTWNEPVQKQVWPKRMYIDYLRGRLISNLVKSHSRDLRVFANAPVVVGHRVLRDAINTKLVQYHSRLSREKVYLYHSQDSLSRRPVPGRIRSVLWGLPSTTCGDMLGKLPLFLGMKVMITENLSIHDGIVNGAEGVVRGIKFHQDEEGRRYADAVYVEVPGSGVCIPGLDPDVVVLGPVPTSIPFDFSLYSSNAEAKSFRRRQIPILPAYSYTDYKSQGRSLDRCIVDLATARGQGVYVMLSRVKRLDGLLIMRWFSESQIFQRFPPELRNELRRIDELDSETARMFDALFSVTVTSPVSMAGPACV